MSTTDHDEPGPPRGLDLTGATRGKYYEAAHKGIHLPAHARIPEWVDALGADHVKLAPLTAKSPTRVTWVASVILDPWTRGDPGTLPWSVTYGKRRNVVADEHGDLSLAEVEIVKRLRQAGWEAAWLDSFGRAPQRWRSWTMTLDDLADQVRSRLALIESAPANAGRAAAGRPDVAAWRGRDVVFLELKRPGDRLAPSQRDWAERALSISPDAYAVIDWGHSTAGSGAGHPRLVSHSEAAPGMALIAGTGVPVAALFEHLERGRSLDDFVRQFPTVSREAAVAILELAKLRVVADVTERA